MSEIKARNAVNWLLTDLNSKYHDGIPVAAIDKVLTTCGLKATEPAIYCGRDGRSHEQVGESTWLALTWHKMEVSGRYEIVAYVS
jgi:hypothetical protein